MNTAYFREQRFPAETLRTPCANAARDRAMCTRRYNSFFDMGHAINDSIKMASWELLKKIIGKEISKEELIRRAFGKKPVQLYNVIEDIRVHKMMKSTALPSPKRTSSIFSDPKMRDKAYKRTAAAELEMEFRKHIDLAK